MRAEYAEAGLDEAAAGDDPVALFDRWFAEVSAAGLVEPNAMGLATADEDGMPSVRTVLLKGFDASGACFFTNYDSRKGRELTVNARAAAVMLWHPLQRQVRIEGAVTMLSDAESDAYFATRPRGSQLGAVASPQSEVVSARTELERRFAAATDRVGTGDVVRPAHWGGYRIGLDVVEFWQGRTDRMHDRIRFWRSGDDWNRDRLAP